MWGVGRIPFTGPWIAWQLLGWIYCALVTLYVLAKASVRGSRELGAVLFGARKDAAHRDEPLPGPGPLLSRRRFLARATYAYAGAGVSIGRAGEEAATREQGAGTRERFVPMRRVLPGTKEYRSQLPAPSNARLGEDVQRDERTVDPSQQLPRDPRARERDAAHAPHAAAEQHTLAHDQPWEVEHDEDRGQRDTHAVRLGAPGGVGKALAQVEVDQHLRCQEEKEID